MAPGQAVTPHTHVGPTATHTHGDLADYSSPSQLGYCYFVLPWLVPTGLWCRIPTVTHTVRTVVHGPSPHTTTTTHAFPHHRNCWTALSRARRMPPPGQQPAAVRGRCADTAAAPDPDGQHAHAGRTTTLPPRTRGCLVVLVPDHSGARHTWLLVLGQPTHITPHIHSPYTHTPTHIPTVPPPGQHATQDRLGLWMFPHLVVSCSQDIVATHLPTRLIFGPGLDPCPHGSQPWTWTVRHRTVGPGPQVPPPTCQFPHFCEHWTDSTVS